ncbi:MAG: hypothetical protein ACFFCW_25580 [Candidatus Hodarchaeota archaeon]
MKSEGLEKVHINEGFSGKFVRTKSFIGWHKINLHTAMGNQIDVAAINARLYEEFEEKIDTAKEKKRDDQIFFLFHYFHFKGFKTHVKP